MNPKIKNTPLLLLATLILVLLQAPVANSADFDQDGVDDFILISINKSNNRLDWFAIDVNDSVRRSLGQFGRSGDHLALGNWSGDSKTSKAFIRKKESGEFEWNMQLASGQKSLLLGSFPDLTISGLDADKNGAIDAVTVAKSGKKLLWKIISNPGMGNTTSKEIVFGGKSELPFYANVDGLGDKIATAKAGKRDLLTIRFLDLNTGKTKATNIKNFNSNVSKLLPAALPNGKDIIFAVAKSGKRLKVTLIKGKSKGKTISVKGDEAVVGRYLGGTAEVLVVRNSDTQATVINSKGKKSTINLDLSGVLADDININTFKKSEDSNGGGNNNPNPPAPPPSSTPSPPTQGYPVCSGVMTSTDHLLYKPISDTSGNAVIVFDSKYSKELVSVKLELKDGSFTEGWWKGLSLWGNPDAFGNRQHWRTNVTSSQVKDNALIIAFDGTQECRFMLPGSANRRWE